MKSIRTLSRCFTILATIAFACTTSAALVTVSSIEVWNGSNNLHSAEGVTLSGSGTVAAPYVYTIPNGMTLVSGGIIRLSGTVVNAAPNNTDTNNVTLRFTGGNLQMDAGWFCAR